MMIIIKQKNKHVLKHLLQNPGVRTSLVRYQHSLFICKKKQSCWPIQWGCEFYSHSMDLQENPHRKHQDFPIKYGV